MKKTGRQSTNISDVTGKARQGVRSPAATRLIRQAIDDRQRQVKPQPYNAELVFGRSSVQGMDRLAPKIKKKVEAKNARYKDVDKMWREPKLDPKKIVKKLKAVSRTRMPGMATSRIKLNKT